MNQLTDILHLPDTQSERDERHVAIQRVGIRNLRYPLRVKIGQGVQEGPALWSLDVALAADRKGTHMSRFVEWLEALGEAGPLDAEALEAGLDRMLKKLDAAEGRIEVAYTFFLRKRAPVSGVPSLLDYQGRWIAERRSGRTVLWFEVAVPVKSLCPCSKEIADYGAHNQRSLVTLRVELLLAGAPVPDAQKLIRCAEDAASSEIWALLKREDEKWVTERAYENPKFVEDLVRDIALRLEREAGIGRYSVDIENFESIHNHSAYARIER
jgi:GTP cyclohydrolase I